MDETIAKLREVLLTHRIVNCGAERVRCSCRHQWMSETDHREHVARMIAKVL